MAKESYFFPEFCLNNDLSNCTVRQRSGRPLRNSLSQNIEHRKSILVYDNSDSAYKSISKQNLIHDINKKTLLLHTMISYGLHLTVYYLYTSDNRYLSVMAILFYPFYMSELGSLVGSYSARYT